MYTLNEEIKIKKFNDKQKTEKQYNDILYFLLRHQKKVWKTFIKKYTKKRIEINQNSRFSFHEIKEKNINLT